MHPRIQMQKIYDYVFRDGAKIKPSEGIAPLQKAVASLREKIQIKERENPKEKLSASAIKKNEQRIAALHKQADDLDRLIKSYDPVKAQQQENEKLTQELKKFFLESGLIHSHIDNQKFSEYLHYNFQSDPITNILYPNVTTKSTEKKETLDFARHASDHFQLINMHYKLFSENDNEAKKRFIEYYKLTTLVGDIIERNNHGDDDSALERAYKATVVFNDNPPGNFKKLDEYLKKGSFFKAEHPLHDALVFSLPQLKSNSDINLTLWRKLIQLDGMKAVRIFSRAAEIEKKFKEICTQEKQLADEKKEKYQPRMLTTALARNIAKQLTYPNSYKDPEMAELCMEHNCPNAVFEKCVEVYQKHTLQSNLPHVVINGADVARLQDAKKEKSTTEKNTCAGYFLVQLPRDDKRSLLLGEITNCCQSIGRETEKCVIDGVTRPNNGFYVLLRARSPDINPIQKDGKINYDECDIKGQGYAWLSQNDNLTFDSWENLQTEFDAIAIPMLTRFAEKVMEEPSSIMQVTIGTGGKTPAYWEKPTHLCKQPELMKEGYFYGDAQTQAIISSNERKKSEISTGLLKIFRQEIKEISIDDKHLQQWFHDALLSHQDGEHLKTWLQRNDAKQFLRTILAKLPDTPLQPYAVNYLRGVCRLSAAKIEPTIQDIEDTTGTLVDIAILKKSIPFLDNLLKSEEDPLNYKQIDALKYLINNNVIQFEEYVTAIIYCSTCPQVLSQALVRTHLYLEHANLHNNKFAREAITKNLFNRIELSGKITNEIISEWVNSILARQNFINQAISPLVKHESIRKIIFTSGCNPYEIIAYAEKFEQAGLLKNTSAMKLFEVDINVANTVLEEKLPDHQEAFHLFEPLFSSFRSAYRDRSYYRAVPGMLKVVNCFLQAQFKPSNKLLNLITVEHLSDYIYRLHKEELLKVPEIGAAMNAASLFEKDLPKYKATPKNRGKEFNINLFDLFTDAAIKLKGMLKQKEAVDVLMKHFRNPDAIDEFIRNNQAKKSALSQYSSFSSSAGEDESRPSTAPTPISSVNPKNKS